MSLEKTKINGVLCWDMAHIALYIIGPGLRGNAPNGVEEGRMIVRDAYPQMQWKMVRVRAVVIHRSRSVSSVSRILVSCMFSLSHDNR